MANDLTKTDRQVILELVNAKTARGFVEASFTWTELPVVNGGAGDNTSLTLIAADNSGYINDRVIQYNRLNLGTDIGAPYVASAPGRNLEFPVGDATTVADIIPELNTRLGLAITNKDVDFTAAIPTFDGTANETKELVIPALGDSLLYIGSITLTLAAEDIDLAVAIPDTDMDGLTYTPPAA